MADRAVILARASSDKQVIEGDTLDDQVLQCSKFIDKNGWELYKVFPLVESGRKGEREYFQEVLQFCEEPKNAIRYVVFINISRFTRQGEGKYFHFKERLEKSGVQIRDILGTIGEKVNTMENYGVNYDWSIYSPTEASEASEANEAKSYVRKVLTQMIGAEINYVRKGYWNRRPPYGYANLKIETPENGQRNVLAPNPREAEFIRTMFKLRATSPMTDKEIVAHINSLGYVTRIYNRRDKRSKKVIGKKGGNVLTVKRLQELISRPVYAGVICEKWTLDQPVKAQFKGLVSKDVFNQANRGKITIAGSEDEPQILYGKELSVDQIKKRRSKDNPLYPFKNVVLCPICGGKIHASASTGKRGVKYPAYHHDKNHKSWRISKVEFEKNIFTFAKDLKFSEDFIKLFEASFLKVWKEQREEFIKESQMAEEYVVDLLLKQSNTLESIKSASSPLVIKALEADYERLESEIASARQARSGKEQNELNIKRAIKYAIYLMEHVDELLLDQTNPMQQGQIFALAFNELPRYSDLINRTPKLAPIFSLNSQENVSKSDLVTLVTRGLNRY